MTPQSEPSAAFNWPVRVYYEDTDAGGVVYHASYLNFMERARTEWLRSLGFEQDRVRDLLGVVFAVRRISVEFLRPARFNDRLTVTAALAGSGRASLDFEQAVRRDADGTLCCRATVNVACVDVERMRATRIPPAILGAVQSEKVDGL
jgi:acyl-CoA thioester hydrolase